MERLYHGTTEESCRSILANGFSHDAVVWTCSDPDMMYFYDQGMVAKEFDLTPGKARESSMAVTISAGRTVDCGAPKPAAFIMDDTFPPFIDLAACGETDGYVRA